MKTLAQLAQLLAALTITLLPSAASAQTSASANLQTSTGLRVACFSPQRAFSESADGKAVLARLATLEAEKARVIDEKNKALQAQERALEQTSPLLTEVVRTQRAGEVEKFRIDVQRFIEDARAELMGIQRDAESAFVIRLKPAVAKVAQDKGLQIVFNVDDGPVAWFDTSLDITSDIIKQLALK